MVIAIVGWLLSKNSQTGSNNTNTGGKDGQTELTAPQDESSQNNESSAPGAITSQAPENTWEGILKASDSAQKGNLMLVMSSRTIYIMTSRDFSDLLDKPVVVSYEGTSDSFRLGNITAK